MHNRIHVVRTRRQSSINWFDVSQSMEVVTKKGKNRKPVTFRPTAYKVFVLFVLQMIEEVAGFFLNTSRRIENVSQCFT